MRARPVWKRFNPPRLATPPSGSAGKRESGGTSAPVWPRRPPQAERAVQGAFEGGWLTIPSSLPVLWYPPGSSNHRPSGTVTVPRGGVSRHVQGDEHGAVPEAKTKCLTPEGENDILG